MSHNALATRLLCFHKQRTSARTRFLHYGASMLAPSPFPAGCKITAAEAIGARFIALTDARGLPAIELELLRKAYEILIG